MKRALLFMAPLTGMVLAGCRAGSPPSNQVVKSFPAAPPSEAKTKAEAMLKEIEALPPIARKQYVGSHVDQIHMFKDSGDPDLLARFKKDVGAS